MKYLIISLVLLLNSEYSQAAKEKNFSSLSSESSTSKVTRARPWKARMSALGGRFGQGDAFEGSLSLGLNYEYFYNEVFGFAGQFYHASYSKKISVADMEVEWKSRAITIAAMGNFHPNIIPIRDLDPYISIGLAHSFVSGKASISGNAVPEGLKLPDIKASGDATYIVGSFNLRYFLDRNLSAIGSVGFGLSRFTVGMDYLF